MRKIILLFVAVLAFSCSSDKTEPATAIDPIVATWKPVSIMKLNNNTNVSTSGYEPCTANVRLSFSTTGTLTNIISVGSDLNNCTTQTIQNVVYLKKGSDLSIFFPSVGEMKSKVTFTNNNNTMQEVAQDGYFTITTVYFKQ